MRASGVLGHVSTQRTCGLARRIGGVEESERCDGLRQTGIHHPRFYHGQSVRTIDLDDVIEPCEGDEDGVGSGKRATREARARTPCHERHVVMGQYPYHADDFVPRAREDDDSRNATLGRERVPRVGLPLGRRGTDPAIPDDLYESGDDLLGDPRHGGKLQRADT